MARDDPEIRFRAPRDLRAWLKERATANRRSLNGEVVYRLEAAMAAEAESRPASAGGAPAAGEASRA